MRSRILPWLLALAVLGLVGGCGHHRIRYNAIVGTLTDAGFIASTDPGVVLVLKDEQDRPIPGAAIEIASQREPLTLQTDVTGSIYLPIRQVYLDENPWIRSPEKPFRRSHLSARMTGGGSFTGPTGGARVEHVKLEGMTIIRNENENLNVLFDPALRSQVHPRVIEAMERHRRHVLQVTGLDPLPWAVVVVSEKEKDVLYIVAQRASLPTTWAYSLEDVENGKFDRSNAHEWLEATLDQALNLHDADDHGRNRIIVDGLAELAAFDAGGLDDEEIAGLEAMLANGDTTVDLPERFRSMRMDGEITSASILDTIHQQGFAQGYTLSFVFWHRLRAEHEPELPRRFVAALRASPRRDFDSAMRLLAELTGDPHIADALRHADVADAIAYLRGLSATPVQAQ